MSNVFQQMFSTFQAEAFRLEGLGEYKIVGGEFTAFQAFLAGEPVPVETPDLEDWRASLRTWTDNGRRICRVRILPRKRTAYLNFELEWGYPQNLAAGEEIYLIEEDDFVREFGPIEYDFWLFDWQHTLRMNYSNEGEFVGGDLLEPTSVHKSIREHAPALATPLREYLQRQRKSPLPPIAK